MNSSNCPTPLFSCEVQLPRRWIFIWTVDIAAPAEEVIKSKPCFLWKKNPPFFLYIFIPQKFSVCQLTLHAPAAERDMPLAGTAFCARWRSDNSTRGLCSRLSAHTCEVMRLPLKIYPSLAEVLLFRLNPICLFVFLRPTCRVRSRPSRAPPALRRQRPRFSGVWASLINAPQCQGFYSRLVKTFKSVIKFLNSYIYFFEESVRCVFTAKVKVSSLV